MRFALITCLFPLLTSALSANEPLPLWLAGAPGSESRANEAETLEGSNVCNVHNPSITPYLPAADKATGTAVIICPGGGHRKLCLGHEGGALAEWFQARGIAAFVLKYRLAREPESTYTIQDHAMADTRRAIRMIRSRATEWHLKPDRLGILGFSAGGELAAFAAMHSDAGQPDAAELIDQQSSRPDFQALIYPGTSHLFEATQGMPPVFIACGYGDRPDIAEGMAGLYLKYKAAGVKAELHIYSEAGHGFGYRPDKTGAAAKWPERFVEWLSDSGFLPSSQS
jgi:acetyl esterase/lipase